MMGAKKLIVTMIMALTLAVGGMAHSFAATSDIATTENTVGDVGEYGTWFTERNSTEITQGLRRDITEFQESAQTRQLVRDYVPIEAKAGLAFMNAMSWMGGVLDISLVRFMIVFMILAYIFWLSFEIYEMMTKGKGAMSLFESAVKKAAIMAMWIAVLGAGASQIFMWIMGPIISVGTYLSDLILNAVTTSAGAQIPDTCAAIREYAAEHTSARMLLDADAAANMLCVPTRLSGFFYTAVAAGWKWMIAGIGTSAFTTFVGAVFVVLFIVAAFKFAFIALGIIADLFLSVLMLPFTAVTETVGKTSYKGIAGDIFNGFLGLFKAESLQTQIQRFINAAIYFVSLSIVVALCAALLSGTVGADLASDVPTLENSGFIVTLLTGVLVLHLVGRARSIAGDIGGKVNDSSDIGKKLTGDIKGLWKKAKDETIDWAKIIRGKK